MYWCQNNEVQMGLRIQIWKNIHLKFKLLCLLFLTPMNIFLDLLFIHRMHKKRIASRKAAPDVMGKCSIICQGQ